MVRLDRTLHDIEDAARDIRLAGAHFGKLIGGFAAILQNGNDTTSSQLMEMLGVSRTKLN